MKTWLNKHKRSLMSLLMILLLSFILNFFDSGEEPQTKAPTAESRIELTEGEGTKAQTEPSDTSGTVDESETDITEQPPTESETDEPTEPETELYIDPDGVYTSMEDVALYLYLYGELPDNFMTKSEARKLGWEGGSLEPYAPACASAATGSETTRGFCRRRKADPTESVISTPCTRTAAEQSASSIPTTV